MSKEQAKGFFEAISKDKKLNEEVKDLLSGQATNEEKTKGLLSLAKRHNFNFTEDELKTSLSIEDLADVSGGMWSSLGRLGLSVLNMFGIGGGGNQPAPQPDVPIVNVQQVNDNGGGNQPAPQPVAPIVNVQQVTGNAQNHGGQQEDGENEAPPAAADEGSEEIRELTPEEVAERQQREAQEPREIEERLARGPLEFEDTQAYFDGYGDRYGDQLAEAAREVDNNELRNRINQLNTLYYRLLYVPQGQELMDRIRRYIATVGWTFDRGTASLQEQISIADALIHEAEEMLNRAEQQRGEEIEEELREEIQHGLDTLALILQRAHTGLPGETDLYTDVQTFLATIDGVFTDENLAEMNRLIDRAREIMMNRAREYTTLDFDFRHIRNNDLRLAQMLGMDKEYIAAKLKSKQEEVFYGPCRVGRITLSDGDVVSYKLFESSGTLVLTGSGNTVIGHRYEDGSLLKQLENKGIVFEVIAANGRLTKEQLPTRDYPLVVRNLIVGDGIIRIGKRAFECANTLRGVYLMGPVQFIDYGAFGLDSHLMEVGFVQPEELGGIDSCAFAFDDEIVSINIPPNADIHKSAFWKCHKLQKQGCPYCKK